MPSVLIFVIRLHTMVSKKSILGAKNYLFRQFKKFKFHAIFTLRTFSDTVYDSGHQCLEENLLILL